MKLDYAIIFEHDKKSTMNKIKNRQIELHQNLKLQCIKQLNQNSKVVDTDKSVVMTRGKGEW